ncbi:hypothetical protein [Halalkalibacter okhensis]|uniref:Uncharacterized protein n=1 Tax=Halalkalibacter okhensis TaxID=333138 RepID=A0A0B0IB85_9BACI|nr:hypothetical protein [Halalkalibacter okhensis]KHF38555.1 hypothetical protein LQ50_20630 [Halalkalibacter okhensis]
MNKKDYFISVVLHGFIGYLWVLFVSHINNYTSKIENSAFISSGILIFIGIFLFGSIVKRMTPINQYKYNHPVNLVGFVTLLLVVFINTF